MFFSKTTFIGPLPKRIAALAWGLFFVLGAQAANISGKLVDAKDSKPIIGAVVQAVSTADSTKRFYATTTANGSFTITGLAAQRYKVSAKYLGYKEWTSTVALQEADRALGTIKMGSSEIDLAEVRVTGTSVRAEQRGDTTAFNADAYKVNTDATTEDLLKKLPGVTVEDGVVKTQGEDVKRVLVDGKPFFGDDPTLAIKNLPADAISKIEVYDRMSDQAQLTGFDDGNSEKTLNIVTKEERRIGQFGRLYGGIGQDWLAGQKLGDGDLHYSAGGNVSMFNKSHRLSVIGMSNSINQRQFAQEDLVSASGGGRRGGNRYGGGNSGIATTHAAGINYSYIGSTKLEVTASYFLNGTDNESWSNSHRQYLRGQDSMQLYDSYSTSTSTSWNHRFNMRLEYKFDDKKSLLYTPAISFQTRESGSTRQSAMLGLSEANSANSSSSNGLNFRNELLWRQGFEKKGRSFSTSLQFNLGKSDAESFVTSHQASYGKDTTIIDRNQKSTNPNNDYSLSARLNYTEPIGASGIAMLSYNVSYDPGKSNRYTYNYDSIQQEFDYEHPDSLYSNIYSNDYLRQSVGLSYQYRTEKMNLSLGIDGQYASMVGHQILPYKPTVDKSFINWMPNARLEYKFTKQQVLRLFYRSQTNVPSINNLQAVLDNTDPLNLSSGDPNLSHSFGHRLFARYNSTTLETGRTFFATIGISATNAAIMTSSLTNYGKTDTTVFTPIGDSVVLAPGARYSSPVNMNGNWSTWGEVTVGLPITPIKSNLNLTASGRYTRQPGLVEGMRNIADSYTASGKATLGSNIDVVDFTLSYNASYSITKNSLQERDDNAYFQQVASARVIAELPWGITPQAVLNYSQYRGLTEAYNQEYLRMDAVIGKKFLKNNQAEIQLAVYDIFNQNKSVSRNITASYIEDATSNVLGRYYLVTFIYRLKNIGQAPQRRNREGGGPGGPSGGFGGRRGGNF